MAFAATLSPAPLPIKFFFPSPSYTLPPLFPSPPLILREGLYSYILSYTLYLIITPWGTVLHKWLLPLGPGPCPVLIPGLLIQGIGDTNGEWEDGWQGLGRDQGRGGRRG